MVPLLNARFVFFLIQLSFSTITECFCNLFLPNYFLYKCFWLFHVAFVHVDLVILFCALCVAILFLLLLLRKYIVIRLKAEKNSALYEAIITSSEDAILSKNLNGIITSWNKGAENIFGYKDEEIIGRHISILIPPDRLNEVPEIMSRIKRNKVIDHYETKRLRKDQSLIDISLTISPLKDSHGVIIGASKIARDITPRKRAEEEYERIEMRFRTKFDKMLEGVEIIGFDWKYLYVNEAYERQVRCTKEELLGFTIMERFPGIEQTEIFRAIDRCFKERIPIHLIDSFTFPDNTTRWFEISFQPVPEGVFILSNDISEAKTQEEELRKSWKDVSDYKYALDESAIVAITDKDGIIKHVNDNFCTISGYTLGELIGKSHRMIVNSDYNAKPSIRDLWSTIEKKKIWKGELENRHKDGSPYWLDTTIVPFFNEAGEAYQYVAIQFDVTQRKKAGRLNEELTDTLRTKSEELVQVFERITDGFIVLDKNFCYTYANKRVGEIVGRDPKMLLGKNVWDEFPEAINSVTYKAFHEAMREQHYVYGLDYYAPLDLWQENYIYPSKDGLSIFIRDVSEKKRAEEAMRKSEQRYRSLIENSFDIVSIIDENFKPFYRSPAAERITGWTNDDMREVSIELTHPDDLDKLKAVLKEAMANPGVAFPLSVRLKHKNGHYVYLEGMLTNLFHEKSIKGIVSNFRDVTAVKIAEERTRQSEKIYQTIASSIPGSVICLISTDLEYLLIEGDMLEKMGFSKEKLLGKKLKDVVSPERLREITPHFERAFKGESFTVENATGGFDILSKYVPLRDEYDQVFATMVVIFDVSELKNAQRALAKLNLELEDKIQDRTVELETVNKELEAFSYSVAHDLRTPLRAIYGYSTILQEDYDSVVDAEGKRLITRVVHNAKRMGTLIDDLLTFSRLGRKEVQRSNVDMNYVAESCIHDLNLRDSYPGEIVVNKLHAVMADTSLLKYVMINLLSNAAKYSAKSKTPKIEISSVQKETEIIYSVRDNGVGFDMAYAGKLFGVFQRLHSMEEFEGTGVGLAIVERIIHRHHGRVWGIGEVNAGATFYIALPIMNKN